MRPPILEPFISPVEVHPYCIVFHSLSLTHTCQVFDSFRFLPRSVGVGRNIAECLLRLDLDPLLISSVGNDASGSILLENLKKLGMDASGIQVSNDIATAVYSAVLCSAGDLDVAIADMRALDAIVSALHDHLPIPSIVIRDR